MKASQAIATFPPQSFSGKKEHHSASLVPRTAGVVIHYEFPYYRPTINLTETRDLVRSSSTPAFSRYFLNSSFFASCVIFDMVADEVWYSERNTFCEKKNVDGRNAACLIGSALALYFLLNHDLSFFRGLPSLLDNITTTPMSLATRQKTAPAKKSLTPLSDINAGWRPHLDQKNVYRAAASNLLLQWGVIQELFNQVLKKTI